MFEVYGKHPPRLNLSPLRERPRMLLLELLLLADIMVSLVTLTLVETSFFSLALRPEDCEGFGNDADS